MLKWIPTAAGLGGMLGIATAALLIGCEGGDSADVVSRNVGLIVEGFYRHTDTNSFMVPQTSGEPIDSMNLRQFGDQLEAVDNNGIVYSGTIGQVAPSNRATFNMQGRSTSGADATIAGNITVEGTSATMSGTYIEPTLVSTLFGVATVPSNAVPPVQTNDVVSVTPTLTSIDAAGGTANFTASGGSGVYSWVVSNNAIGRLVTISGAGNANATYEATAAGQNRVTVTDSNGESASAIVNQSFADDVAEPVTLNQTLVTISVTGTAQFTASGGIGTFVWSVSNPSLGALTSRSGARDANVTYTASGASGDNQLTVADQARDRATALIRQQ